MVAYLVLPLLTLFERSVPARYDPTIGALPFLDCRFCALLIVFCSQRTLTASRASLMASSAH